MMKRNFPWIAGTIINAMVLGGCVNQPTYRSPSPSTTRALPETVYASLTQLNLNESGNEVTIKPLQSIQASVHYAFHCQDCRSRNYQIIVGLAKRSAQACIYEAGMQDEGIANFTLKSPAKPGKYKIRFRILQAANCAQALKEGWHAEHADVGQTIIGTLFVSRKTPEMVKR